MQIFFDYLSQRKKDIQTNKYFVNKTPSRLQNYLPKRPCLYFSRDFVTSYRFYSTKLNFLRRRCKEINNKLDMPLNGDPSALT